MLENKVFKEIANEIKSIHNSALELIKVKDYERAVSQYQRALVITEKLHYWEGAAMSLFNIANVLVLLNDPFQAMHYAEQANEKLSISGVNADHCDTLLSQLADILKKMGIQYEKQGDFKDAIRCYSKALPYADRASRAAMEHEIPLLRGYIND